MSNERNFFKELDVILAREGTPRARAAAEDATPKVDTMANAIRDYERARDELARVSRGLPVSVDVSETGRATLVFRMDWRLARRVLSFCRELNVFEDEETATTADGGS